MTSPEPKFIDPANAPHWPVEPVKRADPDLDEPKPKTSRRRKAKTPEPVEPEPGEDLGLA